MNADEIRALYVETLARAQRAADLKDHPQRDDGTPREDWEAIPERMRQVYLAAAAPFVDALAEAGLLPTEALWAVTGTETEYPDDPYEFLDDDNLFSREDAERKRDRYYPGTGRIAVGYRTEWREVTE